MMFRNVMLWFRKKRSYSDIDSAIAPLVMKMNATGVVRTIASCQGHICRGRPYVSFEAPLEIAAAIEQRLRKADYNGEPWRFNYWYVEGCFYGDIKGEEEYNVAFILHSPKHDENYWKLFWSTWTYGVMRKKLDSELLALSEVVEEAISLQLRKDVKPEIKSHEN